MFRMPWTLYRYIGKELLIVFLMSVGSLTLIFAIVSGIRAVDAGFRISVVMPWIMQNIAYSWYFTVPIALLVTSALTYGRVAAEREYTACCASGVSPLHLYVPMLVLSGIITLVALATQGTLLPQAHYNQRNIARYLVKQLEHLGDSTGTQVIELKDGRVEWQENSGNYLRQVKIYKMIPVPRGAGPLDLGGDDNELEPEKDERVPVILTAGTAEVRVDDKAELVRLFLRDVSFVFGNPQEGSMFEGTDYPKYFERVEIERKNLEVPINEKRKREGDMTTAELYQYYADCEARLEYLLANPIPAKEEDRLRELTALEAITDQTDEQMERMNQLREDPTGELREKRIGYMQKRLRKIPAELWERRSTALATLTFALLGFPIALSVRYRHRMVPLFLAGMLGIAVYYPLQLLGQSLAESGTVPASFALLFSNLVLLAVSGFFTWRLLSR